MATETIPSNQVVFAMLPPIDDDMRRWADRLKADVPGIDVVVADGRDRCRCCDCSRRRRLRLGIA